MIFPALLDVLGTSLTYKGATILISVFSARVHWDCGN